MKNILIACEESQTVCKAFRERGFNAFSCDIEPCSGGHLEWHFKMDAIAVMRDKGGILENGNEYYVDNWDLVVAHPPCTYLTTTGNAWFYHPEDKHLPYEKRRPHPRFPNRWQDREDALEFFMEFANAREKYGVGAIAIENPVGIVSTRWRKPDIIIQPWQFGDEAQKRTCFWLDGLPPLKHTKIVGKGEMLVAKSGKRMAKWFALAIRLPAKERQRVRSKTFPGIAKAIAEQWGDFINK